MKYLVGLTACCLILTGCSENKFAPPSELEEAKIDKKVNYVDGVKNNDYLFKCEVCIFRKIVEKFKRGRN